MARPSQWMQFTQNFNAMNSTMNDAFKKYETGKIKKKDYFAADGTTKLEGDELRSAQHADIADIYEKYGDVDGAMNMRTQNETLKGLMSDNRVKKETEQARIDAPTIQNQRDQAQADLAGLQAGAAQLAADQKAELQTILTNMSGMEFESQADEDSYLVKALKGSSLPVDQRNKAIADIRQFGGEAIALESDRLIAGAQKSMKGGLGKFATWYNEEVADGGYLEIDTSVPGQTSAFVVTGMGDDQTRELLTMQKGEDSNLMVMNQLYSSISDPSNVMGAAVDNLAYRQSKATLDKTKEQTTNIASSTQVNQAKVDDLAKGLQVKSAQIQSLVKDLEVKDARAADILSQIHFRDNIQVAKIEAEIRVLENKAASQGIENSLTKAQTQMLGAQIAQIKHNIDDTRRLSATEIDAEWADFMGKMAVSGYGQDEIKGMKDMFYDSLQDNSGFTVKPK